MNKKNIGSSFDSFLEEEGLLEEVETTAAKRVIAWQMAQAMKEQAITKTKLAKELHTSRAQVDRLLDPDNTSVTLNTIQKAATFCGKRLKLEFV